MHGYVERSIEDSIVRAVKRSPVVAILGPRQWGKSMTPKKILETVGI